MMTTPPTPNRTQRGVTLIELVVTITIMAIVATMSAKFIETPVVSYTQSVQITQLSSTAALAMQRMAEDIRQALPNSVRVSTAGNNVYIEYVPLLQVGRYRSAKSANLSSTGQDILDFDDANDASFDVLGPLTLPAGAQLAVYNAGTDEGNVYETNTNAAGYNRRTGLSFSSGKLSFTSIARTFPSESPSHRFDLIGTPVTIVCRPNSTNPSLGVIEEYQGYALQLAQPVDVTATPLQPLTPLRLVSQVASCAAQLDQQQNDLGMLSLRISLQQEPATVATPNPVTATMLKQIVLDNSP